MMTREETIKILNDEEIAYLVGKFHGGKEALDLALTALRPVSRKQVEKVFSGCINCHDREKLATHIHCWPSFCPACGKPLTDEAVQMVIRRLEALHGQETE